MLYLPQSFMLAGCRSCAKDNPCIGKLRIEYVWDNGTDLDTATIIPTVLGGGTIGYGCTPNSSPYILSSGDDTGTGTPAAPRKEFVYLDLNAAYNDGLWTSSIAIQCYAHWYNKIYSGNVSCRIYWEDESAFYAEVIKTCNNTVVNSGCASSDGQSQHWTVTVYDNGTAFVG